MPIDNVQAKRYLALAGFGGSLLFVLAVILLASS
jgi:hypothetical protein